MFFVRAEKTYVLRSLVEGDNYGVLDELVLDPHPCAVRGGGIGRLESQRLIHLGVKALEAEAREVAERLASEWTSM